MFEFNTLSAWRAQCTEEQIMMGSPDESVLFRLDEVEKITAYLEGETRHPAADDVDEVVEMIADARRIALKLQNVV